MKTSRKRRFRFGVVISEYHREYTEKMWLAAAAIFTDSKITLIRVPGAFEIPLQVQKIARSGSVDAVIAFGLVWQGETIHHTEIVRAVTNALMRISLETGVPVIHEVLCVKTVKQARMRTQGKWNRGREAALAALAVARLRE